jgi:UDPglucose 6-dehydrogenase
MRISVIGCGYLGAVHAAAMVSLGHDVVGIDVDDNKVAALSRGVAPFFEPGLPELLSEGIATGRLAFSSDIHDASDVDIHFLAIGTPQEPSGAADLSYLFAAVTALLPILRVGDLVVGKSTVPVGVAAQLAVLVESTGASLAWNPEFLREGLAIRDTLEPDRLVYGVREGDDRSVALLDELYASILAMGRPRMVTNFATAELVKVAANAFLATKISFINAMAEIAEVAGADVGQLADALGQDPRIGRRFLNAGLGFGGGCLPKDIRGFIARAEELGVGESVGFLREVDAINLRRRDRVVELTHSELGGSLSGRRVAVLGLAFKPDSDDVRDSPAVDVASRLLAAGAELTSTDPQAIETARRSFPGLDLGYRSSIAETVDGAEIVLVLTEWNEYRSLTPSDIAHLVRARTILDARNCLDHDLWRSAGWRVISLGRPVPAATQALALA